MDLELCVGSYDEALLAQNYPFKRIELCSALDVGGLTPSIGLIRKAVQLHNVETHVMIRPRPGDFCYSEDETEIMLSDIESIAKEGASGVVFGTLDENQHLNLNLSRSLVEKAKSHHLEVTFHRAFDFVKDPEIALEQLIELGVDRILTSGQKRTAIEGITMIRSLVQKAQGRIQIMAGSGVNAQNVLELRETGVDALHFTARQMSSGRNDSEMGYCYVPDPKKTDSILKELNSSS